jgi:hypothetical protein
MLPLWVWPKKTREDASRVAKLGRAFHWFGTILAVVIWIPTLLLGLLAAVAAVLGDFGWISIAGGFFYVALYTGAAAAVYFAGRGLRYVLSKE